MHESVQVLQCMLYLYNRVVIYYLNIVLSFKISEAVHFTGFQLHGRAVVPSQTNMAYKQLSDVDVSL